MASITVTKFGVLVEYEEVTRDMATHFTSAGSKERTLNRLPEIVTGYALDPEKSFWSIIVPEATQNYCKNPSFENDSVSSHSFLSWDVSPSVVTSSPFAARGTRFVSMKPVASTAAYMYYIWPYTEGQWTFSCDVYGTPGEKIKLEILLVPTVPVGTQTYTIREFGWNRYSVTANLSGSGNAYAYLVAHSENTGKILYTDGWQIEPKAYATTYCDGDMIGHRDSPPIRSYFWRGAPHDSVSERLITDSLNGRPIGFSERSGFLTTAIVGLGLPSGDISEYQVGSLRKTVHNTIFDQPRDFTIAGKLIECDFQSLLKARSYIEELLRYDNTLNREQVMMRFRLSDSIGAENGMALQIPVVYSGGMAGNITNFYQEDVAIQFRASEPRLQEIYDNNQELAINTFWTANGIKYKDSTGHWQALGTGLTWELGGYMYTIRDCDFIIVPTSTSPSAVPAVVGGFNQLCGYSVDYAAFWNESGWDQIGLFNTDVYVIKSSQYSTNKVYFGGAFSTEDGNTCRGVAVWDSGGISEMANGLEPSVAAIEVGADGWVYLGGSFVQDGTLTDTYNYIAQYDPDTNTMYPINASNPGLNHYIWDMCISKDNWLWACGLFDYSDAGIQMRGVCRVNLSLPYDERVLEPVGLTHDIEDGQVISCAPDGSIYLSAKFNDTGYYEVRRWNGSTWERIGNWTSLTPAHPKHWWGPDGVGYLSDYDYEVPNIDQYGYTISNINQLGPLDIFISDRYQWPRKMAFHTDGSVLMISAVSSGDYYSGTAITTVTNNGSSDVYPIIRIKGPATLKCIVNRTTGAEIWFNHGEDFNAVVAEEETLFIDLTLGRIRIYSNQRKSIPNILYVAQTSPSRFYLKPGDNNIGILLEDTDSNTEAFVVWKNNHWGIDNAI